MQHISGRKSLIGNPKSMTVLSNTGTMRFIIWGFVGTTGSGQIYLFPSSASDSSGKFYCCQHIHMWAIPSTHAALWPRYDLHISSYKYILHAMHRAPCWQHCYLVFCHLDDFQVHHNALQLLEVDVGVFTIRVTVTQCKGGDSYSVNLWTDRKLQNN